MAPVYASRVSLGMKPSKPATSTVQPSNLQTDLYLQQLADATPTISGMELTASPSSITSRVKDKPILQELTIQMVAVSAMLGSFGTPLPMAANATVHSSTIQSEQGNPLMSVLVLRDFSGSMLFA
jgi:hypothetical protein